MEIKMYSTEETINILLNSNKSICRFGDGELNMILNKNYNIGFQRNNEKLVDKLKSILINNPCDNILVSVCHLDKPNILSKEKIESIKKLIIKNNSNYTFGSSNITRVFKYVENFKNIWNEKDIIIVEGEYTRSGINNDLFNNTRSIKRIICPPINAFDKYHDIYNYLINNIDKNSLILCALGPTATVLSYELSEKGLKIPVVSVI